LYGLHILYSNNTTVSDLTSTSAYGSITFDNSLDNEVHSVTLKSDQTALGLEHMNNTKIYNSIVESTDSTYAIYLWETYNNSFYNNLFNVSSIYFDGTNINYWNTTRQIGSRVYSAGTEIGGNYWTNATGNGYSDTCIDADVDGFCDDPYVLDANNADYLALSDEYVTPPPVSGLPLLSRTLVGIAIGFGVLAFMLKTLFDIKEPKKVVEYFIALAVIVLTVLSLIVLFA
jgi:nitrous oxidase accessory protein NosD